MSELQDPIEDVLRTEIEQTRQILALRGTIIERSGGFDLPFLRGSIHTDRGPESQDKDINQDYALAWYPQIEDASRPVRFALAIADGVTSSFRAEWGAQLACWKAVESLSESPTPSNHSETATQAFCSAIAATDKLKDICEQDRDYQPPGIFKATWRYILRTARLFETTLTLLWIEGDSIHFSQVGDGGILWYPRSPGNAEPRIIASCDLTTNLVNAIGPGAPPPSPEVDSTCCLSQMHACILFTDGIGRGLREESAQVLHHPAMAGDPGRPDAARAWISRVIQESPKRFDDNLTLAILMPGGSGS